MASPTPVIFGIMPGPMLESWPELRLMRAEKPYRRETQQQQPGQKLGGGFDQLFRLSVRGVLGWRLCGHRHLPIAQTRPVRARAAPLPRPA